MATIAVPGVFPIQKVGGRVLVDGGVMDPVPVQVARWLHPNLPVVAVMLHKTPQGWSGKDEPLPMPLPGPSSVVEYLSKLRPIQAFKIFSRSMYPASRSKSAPTPTAAWFVPLIYMLVPNIVRGTQASIPSVLSIVDSASLIFTVK